MEPPSAVSAVLADAVRSMVKSTPVGGAGTVGSELEHDSRAHPAQAIRLAVPSIFRNSFLSITSAVQVHSS